MLIQFNRRTPSAFAVTSTRQRVVTTGILLILVSTVIPYQFAFLVLCIVQIATCVRALRVAKETVCSPPLKARSNCANNLTELRGKLQLLQLRPFDPYSHALDTSNQPPSSRCMDTKSSCSLAHPVLFASQHPLYHAIHLPRGDSQYRPDDPSSPDSVSSSNKRNLIRIANSTKHALHDPCHALPSRCGCSSLQCFLCIPPSPGGQFLLRMACPHPPFDKFVFLS